ncbi:MAG: DUF1413 domain-containing protein [Oscillospiraceae bacterium]
MNFELLIRVGLDALSRLTYVQAGKPFTIQQLFDANVWGFIPNQYKTLFSNIFYNYVKNNKIKDIQIHGGAGNNYTYIKN